MKKYKGILTKHHKHNKFSKKGKHYEVASTTIQNFKQYMVHNTESYCSSFLLNLYICIVSLPFSTQQMLSLILVNVILIWMYTEEKTVTPI